MAKPLSGWETPDENGWEDTFPILKVDEPEEDEDDSMEGTAVERISKETEPSRHQSSLSFPAIIRCRSCGSTRLARKQNPEYAIVSTEESRNNP